MSESSTELRAIDRTRYAVICAVIAAAGGEVEPTTGHVGGYISPTVADDALCQALAALAARSGDFEARKDRREYADDMRRKILQALDLFVSDPSLMHKMFEDYDPRNPPEGALGTRVTGTRQ